MISSAITKKGMQIIKQEYLFKKPYKIGFSYTNEWQKFIRLIFSVNVIT